MENNSWRKFARFCFNVFFIILAVIGGGWLGQLFPELNWKWLTIIYSGCFAIVIVSWFVGMQCVSYQPGRQSEKQTDRHSDDTQTQRQQFSGRQTTGKHSA